MSAFDHTPGAFPATPETEEPTSQLRSQAVHGKLHKPEDPRGWIGEQKPTEEQEPAKLAHRHADSGVGMTGADSGLGQKEGLMGGSDRQSGPLRNTPYETSPLSQKPASSNTTSEPSMSGNNPTGRDTTTTGNDKEITPSSQASDNRKATDTGVPLTQVGEGSNEGNNRVRSGLGGQSDVSHKDPYWGDVPHGTGVYNTVTGHGSTRDNQRGAEEPHQPRTSKDGSEGGNQRAFPLTGASDSKDSASPHHDRDSKFKEGVAGAGAGGLAERELADKRRSKDAQQPREAEHHRHESEPKKEGIISTLFHRDDSKEEPAAKEDNSKSEGFFSSLFHRGGHKDKDADAKPAKSPRRSMDDRKSLDQRDTEYRSPRSPTTATSNPNTAGTTAGAPAAAYGSAGPTSPSLGQQVERNEQNKRAVADRESSAHHDDDDHGDDADKSRRRREAEAMGAAGAGATAAGYAAHHKHASRDDDERERERREHDASSPRTTGPTPASRTGGMGAGSSGAFPRGGAQQENTSSSTPGPLGAGGRSGGVHTGALTAAEREQQQRRAAPVSPTQSSSIGGMRGGAGPGTGGADAGRDADSRRSGDTGSGGGFSRKAMAASVLPAGAAVALDRKNSPSSREQQQPSTTSPTTATSAGGKPVEYGSSTLPSREREYPSGSSGAPTSPSSTRGYQQQPSSPTSTRGYQQQQQPQSGVGSGSSPTSSRGTTNPTTSGSPTSGSGGGLYRTLASGTPSGVRPDANTFPHRSHASPTSPTQQRTEQPPQQRTEQPTQQQMRGAAPSQSQSSSQYSPMSSSTSSSPAGARQQPESQQQQQQQQQHHGLGGAGAGAGAGAAAAAAWAGRDKQQQQQPQQQQQRYDRDSGNYGKTGAGAGTAASEDDRPNTSDGRPVMHACEKCGHNNDISYYFPRGVFSRHHNKGREEQ
ncbi:hypothetical protein GGR56DRAFT_680939 [Xylariaceae sp. FL0804]|nr:hypothetical protein GGR56DRAFT_680939 [Xylariaceae sp. FL0804]